MTMPSTSSPRPLSRLGGMKIYLAGPITGCMYEDATDWRTWFSDTLAQVVSPDAAYCASPMRGKHYLRDTGPIAVMGHPSPLSTNRAIMTRDHWDCMTADIIVANLLGTEKVSIGTVMEIGWAHAYRKPLVLVIEAGNLHQHPMVLEAAGFTVTTLEEAVHVCHVILQGDLP